MLPSIFCWSVGINEIRGSRGIHTSDQCAHYTLVGLDAENFAAETMLLYVTGEVVFQHGGRFWDGPKTLVFYLVRPLLWRTVALEFS